MSEVWTGVVADYRVEYADGTVVDVKTGMADALRWERNNKGASLIGSNSLTVMLTLVWYALRRQGLSDVADFETWAATVSDIAKVVGSESDPTTPDQSES